MPIGIIIYSPLMTMKSYINVKMKYFMDSKYISEYELLKIYGLIGIIFYTIICIISTFFEYKEDNENKNILIIYVVLSIMTRNILKILFLLLQPQYM